MLSCVNENCFNDEKCKMDDLKDCINKKTSLVFKAGAGSGKTYALVECLKYVCKEKEEELKYHNQKAVCITYTNVAANEVRARLGNTDLVLISSIHERLWEFIKDYQEELVMIHRDNLSKQISEMRREMENDAAYLCLNEREKFSDILFERQQEFYQIYNNRADEFRVRFYNIFPEFNGKIGNVREFSKICLKIIKIEKYKKCIISIDKLENNYTEVKYDTRNNKDSLHRMRISHDTLLEYANQMIKKYDDLKRFIIDEYPYFFIDEYQDTSELVVEILSELEKYSKKIEHLVFVGYFGDSAQNIYDRGIGEGIDKYCNSYKKISKKYNYRSCSEIIALSNRIRNDEMEQQSIYRDSEGGSVKIYYGTPKDVDNFIVTSSQELDELSDNHEAVHCFLLSNKSVAEHTGLGKFYDWFKTTSFYKRNYDMLSTELLNNDINKLGEIQRYLYNITEFISLSQEGDTPLLDVLPKELLISLDIFYVGKIVDGLKGLNADSLRGMLLNIERFKYDICRVLEKKREKKIIDKAIGVITGIEDFSLDKFVGIVKQVLLSDDENAEQKIEDLLNMDSELITKWYRYVSRNYTENIIYHTFHSTKGLEYDNVILVFGDSFGKVKSYFDIYFREYNTSSHDERDEQYKKARNLLYVAATRARKHLRILYTGDYQINSQAFNCIFDRVLPWSDISDN